MSMDMKKVAVSALTVAPLLLAGATVSAAEIGARVWLENSGDSAFTQGVDTPIDGAIVTLSQNGDVVATTMTGPDGRYAFPSVAPGAGYSLTVDPAGAVALDSGGFHAIPETGPFTVAGDSVAGLDLAVVNCADRPTARGCGKAVRAAQNDDDDDVAGEPLDNRLIAAGAFAGTAAVLGGVFALIADDDETTTTTTTTTTPTTTN